MNLDGGRPATNSYVRANPFPEMFAEARMRMQYNFSWAVPRPHYWN